MSGIEAPPFAFVAGLTCLDFANTATRDEEAIVWESLARFEDLISWGVSAHILTPVDAERTCAAARGRSEDACAALARAIALREEVFRTFAALAERRPVAPQSLAALDRAQRDAFAHRALVADGHCFRWEWDGGGTAFDGVLWRVAESAAELLAGGRLERVRRCAG